MEIEKSVLARGLRFSLPPKNVDKYEVKSSFELLFLDLKRHGPTLTGENEDRLKRQLKNISYNYIYSYDFSKQKHKLNKEEWEALKNLRKDNSIIITKPDKGNGVVIVNKLDYLTKIKQLISDQTKFKKLTENPTKFRVQSLISYLRQLIRDHLGLTTTPFKRSYLMVPHMEFFMVYQRYTKLVVPFVQLFLPRTPTTTTLPLTL